MAILPETTNTTFRIQPDTERTGGISWREYRELNGLPAPSFVAEDDTSVAADVAPTPHGVNIQASIGQLAAQNETEQSVTPTNTVDPTTL